MTAKDRYIEWLVENLKRPGVNQTTLADALGIHPSAASRIVSGERQLKSHEIIKAAEHFGVPAPEVDVVISDERLVAVPVDGQAEAGAFREFNEFDQSEVEMIYLPRDTDFPAARQVAVDIAGDSMNQLRPRAILPGDRVICIKYEDISEQVKLRDGMVVLIERTRDGGQTRERSIKQLELYEDHSEFHPRSSNPRHKAIVVASEPDPDSGERVEIIGIVRQILNSIPLS